MLFIAYYIIAAIIVWLSCLIGDAAEELKPNKSFVGFLGTTVIAIGTGWIVAPIIILY